MSTPAGLYVEGIQKQLHDYFAAWLPSESRRLGDVGSLHGKFFRSVTSLDDLEIPFQERPDTSPTILDMTSESRVTVTFKARGETNDSLPNIPKAEAGVGLEFGKEGTFITRTLFSGPRVDLLGTDRASSCLDATTPAAADDSLYLDLVLDSEEAGSDSEEALR